MKWEAVKNALNQATSDFRALLSTGEVLSLDPKDVIMLIEHAEKSQQQLTKKDATITALKARSDKWEKAFDNADKQYLKKEKEAGELRRENGRLRKALEEVRENIRLIDSHGESPWEVTKYCDLAVELIEAALGEGEKHE